MLRLALSLIIASGQGPGGCGMEGHECARASGEPVADTLHLTRRVVEDTLLARVTGLVVSGPYLLLSHGTVSPHLTLVDRETGVIVNKMGTHGTASTQLEYPSCLQSMSDRGDLISLVDTPSGRIITLRIDTTGQTVMEDAVRVQSSYVPLCSVRLGERILANFMFTDRLLDHFDRGGAPLQRGHANTPPFPGEERSLNRARMVRHPLGDRIAIAYHWASRVDFLDGSGAHRSSFRDPSTPDRTHVSYVAISASLDHVFVGHCGCDPQEVRVRYAERIDVLSWDGELVRQLVIDRPLAMMAVTPGGERIYGAFKVGNGYHIGEWRVRW